MSQNLPKIIRQYARWKAITPDTWIQHCSNQANLNDAIHVAALSENAAGAKHPHQYRLKRSDLLLFERALLRIIIQIQQATDFDSLLILVESARPRGVGSLAAYDTAVRIGDFLQLTPQFIYLHAGTKIGVEKLIGKTSGNRINKNQLPTALQNSALSCYELEDLLCIYKDKF